MSGSSKPKRWSEVVNGYRLEIERAGDTAHLRCYYLDGRLRFSQTLTPREYLQELRSLRALSHSRQ
ncbi:hypothetical protein BBK14_24330 [Parafrankia soli]|uniref:Uncharacterized protein n=1 Tax=Parafrankia soli TaxID=2599596 RepID=A0A1S1PRA5_9ACTN|nr:hypothetical protein [Parafrankia soli]OHV23252.1 hypothetical protein BBK14_24330 [Parafrankia soli]